MRSWFRKSTAASEGPSKPSHAPSRRPSAEEEAAGEAVRAATHALTALRSAADRRDGEPDYPRLNSATRLVSGLAAHVDRIPSSSDMKLAWKA